MRQKEQKPQQVQIPTPVIDDNVPYEQRKRLKDIEQRDVALSGGDDALGQPKNDAEVDKFSDEVER